MYKLRNINSLVEIIHNMYNNSQIEFVINDDFKVERFLTNENYCYLIYTSKEKYMDAGYYERDLNYLTFNFEFNVDYENELRKLDDFLDKLIIKPEIINERIL